MNKPVIQPLESSHTQSANLLGGNIAQLKALFPEAFKEGGIDFEVLKQLLGGRIDEREEKYGLNWHGKRRARQIALTPSTGTLRPCVEDSVDWETTQNLMIEGDNLEVLKLLQKSYAGKVKMIYIDPPYNTGKDFVYPDNFTDNIKNYLELTGQTDGEGRKLSSNTESSGRFHTDWLNMMYPRLKLARNLLREDGVIFVSLDDGEAANIRKLCDEIFGEECFVGVFPWRSRTAKADVPFGVSNDVEWVVSYCRPNFIAGRVGERKYFQSDDFLEKWRLQDLTKNTTKDERPNSFFTLINPKTGDKYPAYENRTWSITEETFPSYYAAGKIVFPGDYDFLAIKRPAFRVFENEDKQKASNKYGSEEVKMSVSTYLPEKSIGRTEHGSKEILELFSSQVFSYPKPTNLISFLIESAADKSALVLDFFAGSGTTGHAAMQLNQLDGGNRRFILVQLPEALDLESTEQKTAANYCDKLGKPRNIAELTKERLRRAAIKIRALRADNTPATGQLSLENEPEKAKKPLDLGFKVFKLDTSNIRAWNPNPDELEGTLMAHTEHLASGRSEGDVLYEILLKQGLDLALPLQKRVIAGHAVHSVGAGALLVCLARDTQEQGNTSTLRQAQDTPSSVRTDGDSMAAMREASVTAANAEALALGMADWHAELAAALGQTPQELSTRVVLRDSLFDGDVAKTNLTAILRQRGLEDVRSL